MTSNCPKYTDEHVCEGVFKQDKHVSVLHLNTNSLEHNFDKVNDLLTSLNLQFSIIGISETWLKDLDHFCDVAGYKFYIHDFRKERSGGGVELYLF